MKVAAIDIGTNSSRLLIGEKSEDDTFKILARELEITRLGEGVDQNKKLDEKAVKRVFQALKKFKSIIDKYRVTNIRLIGTSALRDVDNADLLINKLKELNLDLEIISGKKEAELNYKGAASSLNDNFLLVDIGGGSTEFIWSEDSEIKFESIDIGCVRLTEKFLTNPKLKINAAEARSIGDYVQKMLAEKLNLNSNLKIKGVGGTITTLGAIKLGLEVYDSSKVENLKIRQGELNDIFRDLSKLDLKERKRVKGLQPGRADIILAGLIILENILDYVDSNELLVSDQDLLHGLLREELNKA